MAKRVQGTAFARISLIGNPSDIYGGRAVAMPVRNFQTTVTIEPADKLELIGKEATISCPSLWELLPSLQKIESSDGALLLFQAAIKRFIDDWPEFFAISRDDNRLRFRVSYHTTIPFQVGLSGSSAITIATIRALMQWFDVPIEPARLAELALAAEVEDLGIRAGPLDRVIQSYEKVLHMDFRHPRTAASYTPLDPKLLPPLFVAWDPQTNKNSGKVHNDVWQRWQRGDADVREAIAVFPTLTDKAMVCLKERDISGLQELVNKNFDTRASIFNISARDYEMVAIARANGAAANCGSGGSVIGVLRDDSLYPQIEKALTAKGYKVIRPII